MKIFFPVYYFCFVKGHMSPKYNPDIPRFLLLADYFVFELFTFGQLREGFTSLFSVAAYIGL